jgi:hypothetical protein
MSSSFAEVLNEARYGIKLTEIAEVMAEPKGANARSLLGNLSRFQSGKRNPSKEKVKEIASALGSLRKLPRSKTNDLRDELMKAAGHADARLVDLRTAAKLELSETDERWRLRPDCHRALQTVHELGEQEIQTILDHVGVSTMKLIIAAAERGEEIEVVQLQKISSALQKTAAPSSGADINAEAKKASTVINAGRARIHVDGDVTPAQRKLLSKAAEMIETVLQI